MLWETLTAVNVSKSEERVEQPSTSYPLALALPLINEKEGGSRIAMSLGPKRRKQGKDLEPKNVICQHCCRVFMPRPNHHAQKGLL